MKKNFFIFLFIFLFSVSNPVLSDEIKPVLIKIDENTQFTAPEPLECTDDGFSFEFNQYNQDNNMCVESDDREIENPEEKYKEYVISLDPTKESVENKIDTSGAKFILSAEKVNKPKDFSAVNTFWYRSKNFSNIYFSDRRNMSPMSRLFNSSYVVSEINENTKVYVGQRTLSSYDTAPVYFISANESFYNSGFKVTSSTDKLDFSVGTYNSVLDNNMAGGAIISTKPIDLPHGAGSFVIGSGYYTRELDYDNKNTAGMFIRYDYKRLKLNLQGAKSKYANRESLETGLYFTPELKLTDTLSVKTRFAKNMFQNTDQDLIGLSYTPKKHNPRAFSFSINAANNRNVVNQTSSHFYSFTTKFKL